MPPSPVCVYLGESLGRYGFDGGHPFNRQRMHAFWAGMQKAKLDHEVKQCAPAVAERSVIERFHTSDYINKVIMQSKTGQGFLDYGDTPAFPGVYETAATVVGSTLEAVDRLMQGNCQRAFVPIAGLHHARREGAAGFCVFNDCGVVIETLKSVYKLKRIAYVDIDAHHGDGVYYGFEDDPAVVFADLHEDGRYLYPGTGSSDEQGKGAAHGMKLNIPMNPQAGDKDFRHAWDRTEEFLRAYKPEFVLLQCGADSVAGDPLTHLRYSPASHGYAAERLCEIADEFSQGRLLATGGGGYNLDNIGAAWSAVVQVMVENS